MNGFNV